MVLDSMPRIARAVLSLDWTSVSGVILGCPHSVPNLIGLAEPIDRAGLVLTRLPERDETQ